MSFFKKILFALRDFFFPSPCALCGASLTSVAEIRYALCQSCRDSIVLAEGEECSVCGKPLISEKETCLSCRGREKGSYERLWVLFPYTGKYRRLLTSYKFDKNILLADTFAEKIAEVIAGNPCLKDAHIVPVPPRPGKIKMSGWDQVDHLVKRLEKIEYGNGKRAKVSRCLKRRKSKAQKSLNRTERLENLKGRIFLNGPAPKTALIIDDVITTGSTIEVCSAILKEAGAEKVYALCLFYD